LRSAVGCWSSRTRSSTARTSIRSRARCSMAECLRARTRPAATATKNMSFGACATRDLGAGIGRAVAARGGDGGGICAGSERNADMGGEVRDVARALLRFCELTGGAGFLNPYYSEVHSGQARTRSSGARTSSRGAPRFRQGAVDEISRLRPDRSGFTPEQTLLPQGHVIHAHLTYGNTGNLQ